MDTLAPGGLAGAWMPISPEVDPLALLSLPMAEGRSRWLWASADGSLQLAGLGEAARIEASGPARFAQAREQLARHMERAPELSRRWAWLGGFGFGADHGQASWASFPGLCFVLPEWLLRIEGEQAWLGRIGRLPRSSLDVARLLPVRAQLDRWRPAPPAGARMGRGEALGASPDLRERIARAVQAVRSGRVDKVVLTDARETWLDRPADPLEVLARMRREQPGCASFLMAPEGACAFLGATPERLLRVRGRRLDTMALAGSAPRGQGLVADERHGARLLASAKDRYEHALVVEAIGRALRELGATEIEQPEAPALRRLATIQHLETPISARLDRPIDVLRAAERLHPTPALGGSPREAALALIAELEPALPGRGWFAGGVGWLDGRGEGELSVAIRSLLLGGRVALTIAGAGLVADSDPEAEAREIALKQRVALTALGL